ncbi:hypothetical protein FS749_000098 [Ceratobasidium sp. UAMH 11750]|nr:hypothetical protein FS749_000098 [Ceratobasidium sp. UAMH 11750]
MFVPRLCLFTLFHITSPLFCALIGFMAGIKWADIKLALDARGLTLRQIDGKWRLVDKDTGSAPSGLPRKIKDLEFAPCRRLKGSPGRGPPEGYNLQEKSSMNSVDYRIQQCDLKLLCNRTHAIDMSRTIMKQQTGAVNLVIRLFLKIHPEYEAWRKYGFWNLRAGVQLILRVSACKSQKLLKAPVTAAKPRKRGKPRAKTPVPAGQPAIADQDVETHDLGGVDGEDGYEDIEEGEDVGEGKNEGEGENESEGEGAETHDLDGVTSEDEDEELALNDKELSGDEELENLDNALDTTMANSSWFAKDPNETFNMSVDANGDDEEDDGTFDMSQVTGNSTAGKPASAAHSIASPASAAAPVTSNRLSASTTKSTRTSTPATKEPAPRPSPVPPPAHAPASGKATLPKPTSSKVAHGTPPPTQSASAPPAHIARSSAPPAASRAPVSSTPAAKAAPSSPAIPDSAPTSKDDSAPPVRKSTSASTVVWRGMKITGKNMATIRANAARQAAGDQIRTSPIYRDLIDKLAVDPDYDPASEPLPSADSGHTRDAVPPPGTATAASAPTDANPPAGKSRARPKPKPKPLPEPELDIIADDETDSNAALLNEEGNKVDNDGGSVGASGKGTQNAAGKGKGVAEGERAPAVARKGKAVAEGERVDVSTSTATKKAQGKKAAQETVAKAPAKAPAKKSTRGKK